MRGSYFDLLCGSNTHVFIVCEGAEKERVCIGSEFVLCSEHYFQLTCKIRSWARCWWQSEVFGDSNALWYFWRKLFFFALCESTCAISVPRACFLLSLYLCDWASCKTWPITASNQSICLTQLVQLKCSKPAFSLQVTVLCASEGGNLEILDATGTGLTLKLKLGASSLVCPLSPWVWMILVLLNCSVFPWTGMISTSVILTMLILFRVANSALSSFSPCFLVKVCSKTGICHSIRNMEKQHVT